MIHEASGCGCNEYECSAPITTTTTTTTTSATSSVPGPTITTITITTTISITTTFGFDSDLLDTTTDFYVQAAAAIIAAFEIRVRRTVRGFGFRVTNVRVEFESSRRSSNLPANAKIFYNFEKVLETEETVSENEIKEELNAGLESASEDSIKEDDGTYILKQTDLAIDSDLEVLESYRGLTVTNKILSLTLDS